MDQDESARLRARGRIGLRVAAVAFAVLGLGGPVLLAASGDSEVLAPFYPVGWLIVIGGLLFWLRCWRVATRR